MSILAFLIYMGGVWSCPDWKIGFFSRLMWPMHLGERIAEFAFKGKKSS